MAESLAISRAQLIYGLCLPLAVLLGYFLAEPMNLGSMVVVVLVLSVLSLPLLMRWYHPILVMSWNASISVFFLPGHPTLWMFMTVAGLFVAVLNRSVNARRRFVHVPSLIKPMVFLLAVVAITAGLTKSLGLASLGSSNFGGKGYFFIFAAIAGYLVLTSRRIPPERAGLYVAAFFLSSLTSLVSLVAALWNPRVYYFLSDLFPGDPSLLENSSAGGFIPTFTRLGALTVSSTGLSAWLLARYGVRQLFDPRRPWRLLLFLASAAGAVWCGYRSNLVLFMFSFAAVFYLEGLCRTRWLPGFLGAGLLLGALLLPYSEKLPLVVQRTLSFLPVKIDLSVRANAESSTIWRLEMWNTLLHDQMPKYLFPYGKGMKITPDDLYFARLNSALTQGTGAAIDTGDYHNGPLSVIIPFGIWGVIGFVWFLAAGTRYLYHNYRFGDPALSRINTLLLGVFVARVVFFCFVFGSFSYDLFVFTGLLGLSVSINGPMPTQVTQVTQVAQETPEEVLNRFSIGV